MHDDRDQERRSDYDVTNRVKVSSPTAVRQAVADIFADLYPDSAFDPVWLAFLDFERIFGLTLDEALQVSAHLPVWAEFSIYENSRPQMATRP